MSSIGELNLENYDSTLVTICTVIYISIVGFGAITVSLFIAVLIKGHSLFKEFPFFTIVWHLTIVNGISVILQITCVVPSMFFDYNDEDKWAKWYSLGISVVNLTETATSTLVFLIALNRFSVFVFRPLAWAFTRDHIKYPLLIGWVFILIVSYLRLFQMTAVTKFIRKTFEFHDVFLVNEGPIFLFVVSSSYVIPAAIFLMYIIIYMFLQKKRASLSTLSDDNNNSNNDKSLLLQGFLLAISIMIWRTLFTLTPRVRATGWVKYMMVLLKALSSVLNNILNPILFFTTNQTVRKVLKNLLTCQSMEPKVLSESEAGQSVSRQRFRIKNPIQKIKMKKNTVVVEPIVILSNMDQLPKVDN
ncbi:unnamed protein product [Caenorhabditis bovis]|uniref:G-protein coupled receptors family 1 profile domain-containing protein n=1 Tax=Caenorhabditis bovis TaxID=2654633 RepID=A0A8S1FB10_9PELO|nr:unnamed protein product [Caenorhabditis bovis]